MNLAEIAVELRLSAPMAEVAFAAYLETVIALESRKRLEMVAAEIGLSRDATQLILDSETRRAELLGEGHQILKALIPYEDKVAELIEAPVPISNVIPLHADPLPRQ